MLINLDTYSAIILRKILQVQKESDKELAECFRDDEVINNIINQINLNLEENIKNEGNRNS